ncbi:MAG: hypothetical protein K8R02_09960 [Anaerohalosphaeraceae bacterium]|nr:hypothetical protein [Anaerohalosphaeraceae bacterium]
MTKNEIAALEMTKSRANGTNNMQIPLGQDPGAKRRSERHKSFDKQNPAIVMAGLNGEM